MTGVTNALRRLPDVVSRSDRETAGVDHGVWKSGTIDLFLFKNTLAVNSLKPVIFDMMNITNSVFDLLSTS